MEGIAEVTDQASITVHDVMTENVHTVLMETLVIEAANLMAEKNLRRVVVTDDKTIVLGVVSQRAVLKSFLAHEKKQLPKMTKPENRSTHRWRLARLSIITESSRFRPKFRSSKPRSCWPQIKSDAFQSLVARKN